MPAQPVSYARLLAWLLFYAVLLPLALPRCLDWLSRSSNLWLTCGVLGCLALAAGVALSLYQAGRWLTRYFSSRSSPPLSDFSDD